MRWFQHCQAQSRLHTLPALLPPPPPAGDVSLSLRVSWQGHLPPLEVVSAGRKVFPRATRLCWDLSLGFQSTWSSGVTSSRLSMSKPFFHHGFTTPKKAPRAPNPSQSTSTNTQDGTVQQNPKGWCLDFIPHKSPPHLGSRTKEAGDPTVIPWRVLS